MTSILNLFYILFKSFIAQLLIFVYKLTNKLKFFQIGIQYMKNKIYDQQKQFIQSSFLLIVKDYFIDKENNFQMSQDQSFQSQSNPQKEKSYSRKVHTESYNKAESLNRIEPTPLNHSYYQNKMNKTAKTSKLKCSMKLASEIRNKAGVRENNEKIKIPDSQDKIEKTFDKKQSKLFGKLNKNLLKTVIYKSNRLVQQKVCSRDNSHLPRTNLKAKSRQTSLSFDQQKQNQNPRSPSKKNDNKTEQSKKKIEFTIYQSRKKSTNKKNDLDQEDLNNKSDLLRNIESVYSLPYPYSKGIVIDLFNCKSTNKINDPSPSRRGKSISCDKSKQKQINDSFHKILSKDAASVKNQLKISDTLQKLKKFKIVNQYANQDEIQNLLKGFILAEQPECKWVLLVIDQVFKKIRNPLANDKI